MKYIEHIVREYLCDGCGEPLGNQDGHPYIQAGENNYCYDCALKRGLIDHAVYQDGVISAYRKWGKGFRRDVVRIFDQNGERV